MKIPAFGVHRTPEIQTDLEMVSDVVHLFVHFPEAFAFVAAFRWDAPSM